MSGRPLYFIRDLGADTFTPFGHGGEHVTSAEVADAIRDQPYAALSRYGEVVAGTDENRVASYGTVQSGADLARRLES